MSRQNRVFDSACSEVESPNALKRSNSESARVVCFQGEHINKRGIKHHPISFQRSIQR